MAIRGHGDRRNVRGEFFAHSSLVGYGYGTALVRCDGSGNSPPVLAWGTGKAGDQDNFVTASTGASGEEFVGILLSDVQSVDRTQNPFWAQYYTSATTQCRPVNVLTEGYVLLNNTTGTPAYGDAYLASGGNFTTGGNVVAGKFGGKADGNGYTKVSVDVV